MEYCNLIALLQYSTTPLLHHSIFSMPLEALKSEWDITRPKRVALSFVTGDGDESTLKPGRNVLLLHGWHSTERQMSWWQSTLASRPEARGYRIWNATYDTHWKSFRRTARLLLREMHAQSTLNGIDWSNTILIGYSMGGIVARQMVAYGFDCRALIALCSPHEGALGWAALRFALAGDVGASSLAGYNRVLHALNSHPRDRAFRNRYDCYAITYRDPRGEHAHDGVVSQSSALGESLGEVAHRQTIVREYEEKPFPFTRPHLGGMNPDVMQPALNRVVPMLAGS